VKIKIRQFRAEGIGKMHLRRDCLIFLKWIAERLLYIYGLKMKAPPGRGGAFTKEKVKMLEGTMNKFIHVL